MRHVSHTRKHTAGFPGQLKAALDSLPEYDPCLMTDEPLYLNRADVRAALHVPSFVGTWEACSSKLNYSIPDNEAPMEPYYQWLLANTQGLRFLIYSGDNDDRCATMGTTHWMWDLLGEQVLSNWTMWNYQSATYGKQLGGYLTQFKGISLATVHAAGHMVPDYQPERGLAVLQQFLAGGFHQAQMEAEAQQTTQPKHHHNHHHKQHKH